MTQSSRQPPKQDHEMTRAKECPACQSPPGVACTQPTDTGRRPVGWHHLAREWRG